MKSLKKRITDVFLRYTIMLLLAIPGLWIFYTIFTPLTVYPIYFLLNLFFGATLSGNIVLVNNLPIEIIGACVAASAYYLLLILNLSTPNIVLKTHAFIAFVVRAPNHEKTNVTRPIVTR